MTDHPAIAVPINLETMNSQCPHCRILYNMLVETESRNGTPEPHIYGQMMNVAAQVLADLIARAEPTAIPMLAATMQHELGRKLGFYMQQHHGANVIVPPAAPPAEQSTTEATAETPTDTVVALPPTETPAVDPPMIVAVPTLPTEPFDFPVYPLKFDRAKYH